MNQEYVNWLVDWIRIGVINQKTGKPFSIDDIKNQEYKTAVQNILNQQTVTQ